MGRAGNLLWDARAGKPIGSMGRGTGLVCKLRNTGPTASGRSLLQSAPMMLEGWEEPYWERRVESSTRYRGGETNRSHGQGTWDIQGCHSCCSAEVDSWIVSQNNGSVFS